MTPQSQLPRSSPPDDQIDLDSAIDQLRTKFKIPKVLVDRMVNQESGGNTSAVSPVGARGRFQVMPDTLAGISKQTGKNLDNNNPLDNAYAGLYLLKQNYDKFRQGAPSERGAWMRAVAAYHAGAGNVEKDLKSGGVGIPDVGDGLINTRDHVYSIFNGTKPEEFTFTDTPNPSEPYAELPTEMQGAAKGVRQPIKPRVTSTVTEVGGDVLPEPVKRQPLKFEPADPRAESGLNRLAQSSKELAEQVRMQGMQLPANHPDLLGKHIEVRFKEKPTSEQVDDALLEQLGPGYGELAKQFRQEMGVPLTGNAAVEQLPDGSFVAHGRPTRALIDAINAYGLGGRKAYEAAVSSQESGRAAVARDIKNELKAGEGVRQDLAQAGARELLRTNQLAQNVADLAPTAARLTSPVLAATEALTGKRPAEVDPQSDPNALAIAQAQESIPRQTTWTGTAAETGLGTAGAITRAEALGGGAAFPAEQALENVQRGPEAAYKAGILAAPIAATGPIGQAVNANALSAVERQALLRTAGAAGLAGSAAAGGAGPKEIFQSAITGAAFPVGARQGNPDVPLDIAAREGRTLGVERAQVVPDFQREIAAKESAVNALPSPRGVRVRDQLRGVQPAEVSPEIQSRPPINQIPENLGVVGPRKPIVAVEEGAKLNRWQHRDFGAVTESANQAGVTRGKVRVLDESGVEHVIQRPNMRGEGNQIAVPIREKPMSAQEVDAQGEAERTAPFRVIDRRGTSPETLVPQTGTPIESASKPASTMPAEAAPVAVSTPEPTTALERVRPSQSAPPEPVTRQRSFPQTLERAGLQGGENRDYTVITNAEALTRAAQKIKSDGVERSVADLAARKEITAEDTAAGILLIKHLQDQGNLESAVNVASDLSRKLTEAGQSIQAASIVSRLSPEGVLLAAQKQLRPEQKLTRGQAQSLLEQAKRVEQAEARISALEKQMQDSGAPPVTEKSARQRVGNLQERLVKMETDARARLEARKAQMIEATKGPRGQRGAAVNPAAVALDIADYSVIGAAKLARKGITAAEWSKQMAEEFGDAIKPHLDRIYKSSYALYDEQRKQFLQESRVRGALRAQPDAKNVQAVINERLDAQTEARKARANLARTFRDLSATRMQKVGRGIVDVTGLTRALTTTADLSFGFRQGKMGLARHPKIWADAFVKQFKALNTKQYERLVSQLETDPEFKYAKRFGLDLTSVGASEHSPLGGREEAFQSRFVQKLPIVRHSEQAYSTMADHLRMGWFKDYVAKLRKLGLDPENPKDRQAFEEGVSLINNATGRGSLGRLQSASPALATVIFSPRFWASRVKMLSIPFDPRTYTQMTRPARVEAFKTLFSYAGLVSSQLALAKLSGAEVDTDPNSPDFLKARWGKLHVDFSGGFQSHIRVATRLMKAFYDRQQGRATKTEPVNVLEHYFRGKESPNASLVHDLFLAQKKKVGGETYGTDFKGDPTSLLGVPSNRRDTSALANRLLPMIYSDASDAYDADGWTGVAETLPLSTLGEGVSVYDSKKKRGH
jgi:hypothetical protein